MPVKRLWPVVWMAIVTTLPVTAEQSGLETIYGGAELVSIATGMSQPITRAPAVASVITAEEIATTGAVELSQVLEMVPGLHVSTSAIGYNPIYSIRGIHSEFNPQVLVLINGVPLTNVYLGNRGQSWAGLPTYNIERVEVIRGPGSAVYGADAFAGVINVVTKNHGDLGHDLEIGGRRGSDDTGEAWFLFGRSVGDVGFALTGQFFDSDGTDETIRADQQTVLDNLFGTSASAAPGAVSLDRRSFDLRFDATVNDWRFRLWRQRLLNKGTGAGVSQALDPVGNGEADRFTADLTFDRKDVWRGWDTFLQVSYFEVENRSNLQLFPPGAFGGLFPDGLVGNPDVFERHSRFDGAFTYHGFQRHRVRIGGGYRVEDLYDVKESKNFCQPGGGLPLSVCPFVGVPASPFTPIGPVTDVSATAPFVEEQDREVKYISLQDEWEFARDWTLTAGVRYDDYSDFGGTTNPRLALVWQTRFDLTTKFLYGRAFRAPSFAELFNINNPVALGNPDLDPETIDTFEIAFDWRPRPEFHGGFNTYWYRMDDILRFASDPIGTNTASNTGEQTGYGAEWELWWKVHRDVSLYGNYAYQRSRDDDADHDVGFAPTHQLYGRIDWQFRPSWNLNTQVNWVGGRRRSAGDPRSDIGDYTLVDLTLRGDDLAGGWTVAVSVRNLFDEDAREPSLGPSMAGFPSAIPADLPLAGRTGFIEVRRSFGGGR